MGRLAAQSVQAPGAARGTLPDGVDVAAAAGTTLGVLGHNGAGKTT
ncbi:ABC transporter ATP-binding protein, partial [Rhodococcus oxybenzonivorans]|nr:ABC transporter ATP-binding protein [Rhodococcus oxybenzonivorans]